MQHWLTSSFEMHHLRVLLSSSHSLSVLHAAVAAGQQSVHVRIIHFASIARGPSGCSRQGCWLVLRIACLMMDRFCFSVSVAEIATSYCTLATHRAQHRTSLQGHAAANAMVRRQVTKTSCQLLIKGNSAPGARCCTFVPSG